MGSVLWPWGRGGKRRAGRCGIHGTIREAVVVRGRLDYKPCLGYKKLTQWKTNSFSKGNLLSVKFCKLPIFPPWITEWFFWHIFMRLELFWVNYWIDIAADFRKFLARNTSKNSIILDFFFMRKAKKPHNSKYMHTIKKSKIKNLAIFRCISGEKLRKNGLTLTYPSLTLTYQERRASPPWTPLIGRVLTPKPGSSAPPSVKVEPNQTS